MYGALRQRDLVVSKELKEDSSSWSQVHKAGLEREAGWIPAEPCGPGARICPVCKEGDEIIQRF